MPARYCTECWEENAWGATACARCGAALIGPDVDAVPYVEKLLAALRHPEPVTRARAAAILGEVGEPSDSRVIHALIGAIQGSDRQDSRWDAGLQAAAARSLAMLGACEAIEALRALALDEGMPLIASLSAVEALADLARGGCDGSMDSIELIARSAGRQAVRDEACMGLARLNEPE